ncbi:MAG TPA: hypothetical protein PKH71_09365, partial [Methanoregulaceae archaeon]|nr:hypothetical protein [Methanoregulaceae archaeon]
GHKDCDIRSIGVPLQTRKIDEWQEGDPHHFMHERNNTVRASFSKITPIYPPYPIHLYTFWYISSYTRIV